MSTYTIVQRDPKGRVSSVKVALYTPYEVTRQMVLASITTLLGVIAGTTFVWSIFS